MNRFQIANSKQNIEKSEHQTPKSDTASAMYLFRLDFHLIEKSAIGPRLIRDCEAIEEPPNVATSPCHVSCPLPTCLTSVPFCLDWTLYRRVTSINVYVCIYRTMMKYAFYYFILCKIALNRTKPFRDCHLWDRGWLAVDRRL